MKVEEQQSSEIKQYWQENIEAYGKFYDATSEEKINAIPLFNFFYKRFIFPIERNGNLERYRKTVEYIEKNVTSDTLVIDLGCGTGVFTTEILRCGGEVIAVDFVESALSATKKRVELLIPEKKDKVEYILLDIMEKPLPRSDIVICIGVTPYVNSLQVFFSHILPTTKSFFCLFLNDEDKINRIRRLLPFLNVRGYYFHNIDEIEGILKKYNFIRKSRQTLCTGFLDEMSLI